MEKAMKNIAALHILLNLTVISFARANSPQAIDLGSVSVESSIRRPTTQIIESRDALKTTAVDLLLREFKRIERAAVEPPIKEVEK